MRTRIATILAQEDLGAAGTKTIDINLKDIISRMSVTFRATNVSETMGAHPAANVSKIELVDGSDVLYSLSGHQAQGVNFYERDKKPFNYITNIAAHVNTAVFGLDFGNFLFDPMLGFDPTKFTNPQLKITWDEDACEVDAAVSSCEVRAHIFDEFVPSPTGFLMTKEVYSYLVQTSGYEYIDLPTDYAIKQIYIKCLLGEYSFDSLLDEVRISEDNDRRVPLDLSVTNILKDVIEAWGYCVEYAYLNGVTGTTVFYAMPSDLGYGLQSPYGAADASAIWSYDGGKWAYTGTSASVNHKAVLHGCFPHGMMPILPKPGNAIAEWYGMENIGSLKLRIKDGAHSADVATGEIVTTQYRPY